MEYPDKTPEEIQAYNAKRDKERREYARKMYYAHLEKIRLKRNTRYKIMTPIQRKTVYEYIRKNYYANKIKWFARMKAFDVPLKDKCELCSSTLNLERHHPDYSKPLDFITFCRECHRKLHRK